MASIKEIIERWKERGKPDIILDLSNWDLTELPDLPDEVERLDISNTSIKALKKLPLHLKWLKCQNSDLEHFPEESELPPNLKKIDCRGCDALKPFRLSKNIQLKSDFKRIEYEEYLKRTPNDIILEGRIRNTKKNIKKKHILNIYNLNLKHIPDNIPDTVTELCCGNNPISNLNNLPKNLKILYCQYTKIKSLKNLPQTLEVINCSYTDISYLDGLPNTINTIICSNCKYLRNIYNLPQSLEYFYLRYCPVKHIRYIPNKCKELDMEGLYIKYIPYLPDSLDILRFNWMHDLIMIINLPNNLKVLETNTKIRLPELHKSLEIIEIPDKEEYDNHYKNKINNLIKPPKFDDVFVEI